MSNIGNSSYIKKQINDNSFHIKKQFGQNFLVDQNVLNGIIRVADIGRDINVIEIGPGLGSLTEHLCKNANKVLCYEIDKKVIPLLKENLSSYNNYQIINEDILKADISTDIQACFDDKPIYLIANLPYYITTPIILGLLEKTALIRKYVVMTQDEVAMRICSKPNVKDYNALSLAIQYRSKAVKELSVSRNSFVPKPNVDSAVISLSLYDEPLYPALDEKLFFTLIRQCFMQRRKTLANNLAAILTKVQIASLFQALDLDSSVRSEQLDLEMFVKMANFISTNLN